MFKPSHIVRSPREHFMRAVDDELAKFERKEREFRHADQQDRAAKLGLPLPRSRPSTHQSGDRGTRPASR
jgi:hypothetical protein